MEKETMKRIKLNAYVVPEVKEYVDSQAKNYGLSTSAYITMIIQNHRMQTDALASIETAKELMAKMEELNKGEK